MSKRQRCIVRITLIMAGVEQWMGVAFVAGVAIVFGDTKESTDPEGNKYAEQTITDALPPPMAALIMKAPAPCSAW